MVVEEVRESVRAGGLLDGSRPLVAMLSGGRDSTCLIDVAVAILGPGLVSALHVNYGLREQSREDERHCAELCRALGVHLTVLSDAGEPPGRGGIPGNLQAWAREVRYSAAERLARECGGLYATGHTASDQVETILYRLAASPGRRALLGMVPAEGLMVRPLLGLTREQTGAYCDERGLELARGRKQRGPLVRPLAGAPPARPRPARDPPRSRVQRASHRDAAARGDRAARRDRAGGARRRELDLARSASRSCRERSRGSLVIALAEQATGTYVPQAGGRVAELIALGRRGGPSGAACRVRGGRRDRGGNPADGQAPAARAPDAAARGLDSPAWAYQRALPSSPAWARCSSPPRPCRQRVAELGEQISRDYEGRPLLLVGVLKGAVFFLSDLMRFIDIPVEVDFMAVASYGSATDSSGVVRILKDLDAAIEDRDVLIVEDIVDSGLTLQYLLRNLGSRNPRTLEVCALLTKPERRKVDLPTRYIGFEIPDKFVVGYGLDYAERHRNLPFVAVLES